MRAIILCFVDFLGKQGGRLPGTCIYAHTLCLTDVASGCTECVPLLVRDSTLVAQAA